MTRGTRVSNRLEVGDDFFLITQAQMELFFSRLFQDINVGLGGVFANVKMLFLGFSPNDSDLRAIVHRLYKGGRHSVSILDYSSVPGRRGGQGGLE